VEKPAAPDAPAVDPDGYPLNLSYDYLSGLSEEQLDELGAHIAAGLGDGNPQAGQRWEDYALFMDVHQAQEEIVDDQAGQVADDEVQRLVDSYAEQHGRPGLTHPAVGGSPRSARTTPTRRQVQDEYATFVAEQYIDAENATNGYLINRRGETAGIDPRSLFSGDVRRVYAYASPELLEWFETNRRVGWAEYYYQRTGSPGSAAAARRSAEANARINRDRTEARR
jgi:hypothetical protein